MRSHATNCIMALGNTQKLILIGLFTYSPPGDGYEIYSPQIEQSDGIPVAKGGGFKGFTRTPL